MLGEVRSRLKMIHEWLNEVMLSSWSGHNPTLYYTVPLDHLPNSCHCSTHSLVLFFRKSAKGGIHGLEKSLEDFYAACDQLQLCLVSSSAIFFSVQINPKSARKWTLFSNNTNSTTGSVLMESFHFNGCIFRFHLQENELQCIFSNNTDSIIGSVLRESFHLNGHIFRFHLQENELSSVITQTVPLGVYSWRVSIWMVTSSGFVCKKMNSLQ